VCSSALIYIYIYIYKSVYIYTYTCTHTHTHICIGSTQKHTYKVEVKERKGDQNSLYSTCSHIHTRLHTCTSAGHARVYPNWLYSTYAHPSSHLHLFTPVFTPTPPQGMLGLTQIAGIRPIHTRDYRRLIIQRGHEHTRIGN